MADTSTASSQRFSLRTFISLMLVLVALVALLYPVVATVWNNHQQAHVAQQYSQLEKTVPVEELNAEIERAHIYNDTRPPGPILDPWETRSTRDNPEYDEYLSQLDISPTMGRVLVPSIHVDLPIYHGTTEDSLQRGAGHLYGTDLPVGGPSTHAVVTAHTGMNKATMFDDLVDVVKGDAVYIYVSGEKLKYEVRDIRVVLPEESDSLRPDGDRDLLTLVTCTPYGVNTHRLLVTAERVPMDPEDEVIFDEGVGNSWPVWMIAFTAVSTLVVVLVVVAAVRSRRRSGETTEPVVTQRGRHRERVS